MALDLRLPGPTASSPSGSGRRDRATPPRRGTNGCGARVAPSVRSTSRPGPTGPSTWPTGPIPSSSTVRWTSATRAGDKVHGRIWRIVHRDRPLAERPEIEGAPEEALLGLLLSPDRFASRQGRPAAGRAGPRHPPRPPALGRTAGVGEGPAASALAPPGAGPARPGPSGAAARSPGRTRPGRGGAGAGLLAATAGGEPGGPFRTPGRPPSPRGASRPCGPWPGTPPRRPCLSSSRPPTIPWTASSTTPSGWGSTSGAGNGSGAVLEGRWSPEGRERQLDHALRAVPAPQGGPGAGPAAASRRDRGGGPLDRDRGPGRLVPPPGPPARRPPGGKPRPRGGAARPPGTGGGAPAAEGRAPRRRGRPHRGSLPGSRSPGRRPAAGGLLEGQRPRGPPGGLPSRSRLPASRPGGRRSRPCGGWARNRRRSSCAACCRGPPASPSGPRSPRPWRLWIWPARSTQSSGRWIPASDPPGSRASGRRCSARRTPRS